ncbi:MAG: site-2 protease family protein [Clostridium sp.]|jgi:stage IV sporulation protein FB|nr:site-2 protease family protein [Clostridium sp.]
MRVKVSRCTVDLQFLFAAAVTLMLIFDTGGTAALGLASCVAHELGHLVCLLYFGEQPRSVRLGAFGMRIERTGAVMLNLRQECALALAGPGVNLLLALIFAVIRGENAQAFRQAALVNLGIALFNLLPIESLDGGRALYYLLCAGKADEEKARKICSVLSVIVLLPLICLGVALLVASGYNFTLLLVSVYLFALLWFKGR